MSFFKELASKNPTLKYRLTMAHMNQSPEEYLKKCVTSAGFLGGGSGMGILLFGAAFGWNPLIGIALGAIATFFFYHLFLRSVDVAIQKRAKDIDREVLFAGRFLLVKLNSGAPLVAAITEASHSYGVASVYFKEIARDIELGTPIEDAVEHASRYSASESFRRIIFQIANALRIGVDVTPFLEATLDEIAETQLIEIKRYGKKLSGLTMFYMLLAIIVPSLGITLFITAVSFLSVSIDLGLFFVILFFLVIIEFFFITLFRSSRPNINI